MTLLRSRRSRRWRVAAAATCAVTVFTLATTPVAEAGDDAARRREEIRRRRAELAAELDVLAASDAEIVRALEDLEAYVALQEATVAELQDQLAQAIVAARAATAAERAKAAEVADLEERMQEMAVRAYMRPPALGAAEAWLDASTPNEARAKTVYLGAKARSDADVLQELAAARRELGARRATARAAAALAERRQERAANELASLLESRDRQRELGEQVRSRAAEVRAEADMLAAAEHQLTAELRRRTEELLERATTAPGRPGPQIVSVQGIRVHGDIAEQLAALLDSAGRDGVELAGWGFRSYDQQVELRRAHCGETPEAIFDVPPSSCQPWTARPGTSMHELGLAVDLTYGGQVIPARTSPAFAWLADNAERFGFYNLPAEPWHWSINGR